jgi:1-acyl-sn-glycerol-3-phosphate acyltransferase
MEPGRWRGLYQVPLAFVWLFVYYTPLLLFTLLTLRLLTPALIRWYARVWGRVMLALLSIRLEVEGEERVRARVPRVLIFNHTSTLDLFVVTALFPPAGVAVVKKEIARFPLVGLLWWALGMIFIDRGDGPRARQSVARAALRIRRLRQTVILAPEGTRSPDGTVLPFKKGAFHLALETGAPIVPLVIFHAHRLQPKGALYLRPGVVRARFLEPIPTDAWTREDLPAHVERVRALYVEALAQPADAAAEAEASPSGAGARAGEPA